MLAARGKFDSTFTRAIENFCLFNMQRGDECDDAAETSGAFCSWAHLAIIGEALRCWRDRASCLLFFVGSEARGMDSGCALQDVDFQAGIVGQHIRIARCQFPCSFVSQLASSIAFLRALPSNVSASSTTSGAVGKSRKVR